MVLALVIVIGLCIIFEVVTSTPDWGPWRRGSFPVFPDGALYIAIGIIGATVMPHNLYLHSALVQTRAYDTSSEGKRQLVDST